MPRIYDSQSNPVDYCAAHFPKTEAHAFAKHGDEGDGPDGRGNCFGYDAEHPPYNDEFMNYRCHTCKCRLVDGRDD
jgi:hypothetical protein